MSISFTDNNLEGGLVVGCGFSTDLSTSREICVKLCVWKNAGFLKVFKKSTFFQTQSLEKEVPYVIL